MTIAIVVCFVLAAACIVYSVFAFQEKGPLLATTFFVGTPQEREKMKTKAGYRFVASVFLWIGLLLLLAAMAMIFSIQWIFTLIIVLGVLLAVYAIIAGIRTETKNK